jgi:translation initiation factor 1
MKASKAMVQGQSRCLQFLCTGNYYRSRFAEILFNSVAGKIGKGVTTVFDVPLDERGLRELAGTLKQRCGTGGTVKDWRIEIQGDQRERIVAELEKLGYKVKRVGG